MVRMPVKKELKQETGRIYSRTVKEHNYRIFQPPLTTLNQPNWRERACGMTLKVKYYLRAIASNQRHIQLGETVHTNRVKVRAAAKATALSYPMVRTVRMHCEVSAMKRVPAAPELDGMESHGESCAHCQSRLHSSSFHRTVQLPIVCSPSALRKRGMNPKESNPFCSCSFLHGCPPLYIDL